MTTDNLLTWEQVLCGEPFLKGRCYRDVMWTFPTYSLLTFICAFYIGKHHKQKYKFYDLHILLRLRIIMAFMLLFTPIIRIFVIFLTSMTKLYIIDYAIVISDCVCWFSLILYICKLPPEHNQVSVNISFFLCYVATVLNFSYIISDSTNSIIDKYSQSFKFLIQSLYIISLVFKSAIVQHNTSTTICDETDSLLGSTLLRYDVFSDVNDPNTLGQAENCGCFSRLFLSWVKPLMNKGEHSLIQNSSDLFDLPEALHTSSICFQFQSSEYTIINNATSFARSESISLLRRFHRTFGVEYYSLGLLKLISDLLSFSGPILLNLLVSFLEDDNQDIKQGCYYALAMFVTSFIGALCSTQYNYAVNRIGLKIRAALISTIYQKALNVSQDVLSKFSTGEIVNFMSTDTDRIVNFCQSFHQFWSLPVQVAVTLYLLHLQIGFSFLVGVGFAVLMIPLNHYIAKKIGKYSACMMKEKDKRIKLMSEILSGIKVIKMHAWEDAFSTKIDSIRTSEMEFLKKRKYLDAFCVYFWATTPVIISFLSFTVYALLGHTLTASRIFTSIALFNMLIVPLNAFPWVLNGLVEAFISVSRVQKLLKLPTLNLNEFYSEPTNQGMKIEITNAAFTHSVIKEALPEKSSCSEIEEESFALGPLNIMIPKGKFVCVIGKVGTGKSTFLASILADLKLISGSISVSENDWSSGIGLVSQEPWIQQSTIRDNITFGKTLNSLRYRNVLEACALFDDLKILPLGDKTEVGEKGITLSGGQKARIALARAVYQDVDIYLLDDPLASVDAHVADHIFNHCLLGLLKNKTRILCTHRFNVVEKADMVIVLEKGLVIKQGPPEILPELRFTVSGEESQTDSLDIQHEDQIPGSDLSVEIQSSDPLVAEEEKDSGNVKLHVFGSYWTAIGSSLAVAVLASCFFMQASRTVSDWWLSFWIAHTDNSTSYNDSDTVIMKKLSIPNNDTMNDIDYYLYIYGGLTAANSAFTVARAFLFAYSGLKAARILHNRLKTHILKATMDFFCATPLGRMLNRFSTDCYTVDDSLPFMLNILLAQTFALFGCIAITVYSLPFIVVILTPLAIVYYNLQLYYRKTSRELKRISSITLSPIYAHFSETLSGHSTIRALVAVPRFEQDNMMKLDANQQALFATLAASQWLNLRLQLIGVVFVTSIAIVALVQHQIDKVEPALVGLALSYALSVTALLNGFVSAFTETEKEMVSVERIVQYIEDVPAEEQIHVEDPSFLWLSHGVVRFKDVCLQYTKTGPYALEFVTFETKRAEKLGIVGRTGSGKSSLIQALFRTVDINYGQISIDGVDISKLNLKTLRSHLSVVPQDPFLYSGTLRENLDPDADYRDDDIWRALQSCHMQQKIQDFGGLDSEVEERGRNFSAGERQLLCLARALLHKAKILCLDEATASIDQRTDSLLQLTIRMAFRHTTIFIIAHRIETVMDCDRIMVMGQGRILELDKPSVLLEDTNSEFYKIVYPTSHQESNHFNDLVHLN